jgi:excisionase family DNA binding protein
MFDQTPGVFAAFERIQTRSLPELIDVSEAASAVGSSTSHFYDLIRQGVIRAPVVVRLGRRIKISSPALRNWLMDGGEALPGGWRREEALDSALNQPRD